MGLDSKAFQCQQVSVVAAENKHRIDEAINQACFEVAF